VAAGTLGVPTLVRGEQGESTSALLDWRGPRQAGVLTERTEYAMVAAFDVVDDDLPRLLEDLTGRIAELTQGWPDRLDSLDNAALPPSDTGELGYDRRTGGRLTLTIGFGASLFDDRFGLGQHKPGALKPMPAFSGDNLTDRKTHGDIVVLAQSDHAMISHHAIRDVMRRTKGRLEGRWAQAGFQRVDPDKGGRPGESAVRGLIGFPDGSQNVERSQDELVFTGREVERWARGGTYLAARLIRLKLERWDRLSRSAQEDSIGRRKVTGGPMEGGSEQDVPKLGSETPENAHIRRANPRRPGDEKTRFLRRSFVYAAGFDEYGLLDSGSIFLAYSRDVVKQFEASKRRMLGQDFDEYAVAFGGGYFFIPPGVRGKGDYLGKALVTA